MKAITFIYNSGSEDVEKLQINQNTLTLNVFHVKVEISEDGEKYIKNHGVERRNERVKDL